MTGVGRVRSTAEFKPEAARLVLEGQMFCCAATTLFLSDETPENRRKAGAAGGLRALIGTAGAERMEIARLKTEPAKPRSSSPCFAGKWRVSRCAGG